MPDTQEIIIQAQKDVIKAHGLCDWFEEYPWLTGFIGDIHAPVWFLAENPSLSRLEEKAEEGASNENDQWNASAGDCLLREAITEAGLKTGDPKENEGWECYISNVDKEPCVVNERNAKKKEEGREFLKRRAEIWCSVLQNQVDLGSPKIIVTLGGDADYMFRHMKRYLGLRAPRSQNIHHYTYVMGKPERGGKKRGPGHPERVKEFKDRIADIAKRYA